MLPVYHNIYHDMTSLYYNVTSLYHYVTSLYHNVTSLYHDVYNAAEDVKAKNVAQSNIHRQATPHMLTTTLMYLNIIMALITLHKFV